jgi:hypothetical protein
MFGEDPFLDGLRLQSTSLIYYHKLYICNYASRQVWQPPWLAITEAPPLFGLIECIIM